MFLLFGHKMMPIVWFILSFCDALIYMHAQDALCDTTDFRRTSFCSLGSRCLCYIAVQVCKVRRMQALTQAGNVFCCENHGNFKHLFDAVKAFVRWPMYSYLITRLCQCLADAVRIDVVRWHLILTLARFLPSMFAALCLTPTSSKNQILKAS